MSERTLGYVVIEWNQASHRPELVPYPALWRHQAQARMEAAEEERRAREVGRRERYTVAAVVEVEGNE